RDPRGELLDVRTADLDDARPRVRRAPAGRGVRTRHEEQLRVGAVRSARVGPVRLRTRLAVRLTDPVLDVRQRTVAESARLLRVAVRRDERGTLRRDGRSDRSTPVDVQPRHW